jgi:hypothetical protein
MGYRNLVSASFITQLLSWKQALLTSHKTSLLSLFVALLKFIVMKFFIKFY